MICTAGPEAGFRWRWRPSRAWFASTEAAAAIRTLGDQELDRAAPASRYAEAPITCQFMLEDHAVRHSYHHFARIRATLQG
jgi:hypothetical protein